MSLCYCSSLSISTTTFALTSCSFFFYSSLSINTCKFVSVCFTFTALLYSSSTYDKLDVKRIHHLYYGLFPWCPSCLFEVEEVLEREDWLLFEETIVSEHQVTPFSSTHTQSAQSLTYTYLSVMINTLITYWFPITTNMLYKVHPLLYIVESNKETYIFLLLVLSLYLL